SGGVTLTQVHGRFFHVHYTTPANSTFGAGANHTPNAEITVSGFTDAFDASFNTLLVPQQGTSQKLDTLGDKIMTPVVYQNVSGTESLWADHTIYTNAGGSGPMAVRWYQFDVTGGTFPATPVQQQTWNNGGDGLFRWMPSIAVDQNGNTAIGYSTSSSSIFPSIRYAGRLAGDPPGNLGQGEAIMTNGGGAETSGFGRWGDYTYTAIDPANGKFYAMGGRDVNNVEFTHPFEYDPVSNSWTTKSATYPDNHVNNMACSVLNDSGTDYIYCAGGSEFTGQTTSGHVFRYDPVADSITTVASNWPPGDAGTLPGGFTVFNNKLYTLGGFDIPNGIGTSQIWEFTPNPAGWILKNATLPVPLGYIPTTTIGNLIYTGGGADITGGVLTDTQNSFVYDPGADSISTIAQIPTA